MKYDDTANAASTVGTASARFRRAALPHTPCKTTTSRSDTVAVRIRRHSSRQHSILVHGLVGLLWLACAAAATAQWFRQNPRPALRLLNAVSFADASIGMAVGNNGLILRTEDGGTTWFTVEADFGDLCNGQLHGVHMTTPNIATVVGFSACDAPDFLGFGVIYRTTDGGSSWVEQYTSPTISVLFDVSFADSENGLAVGVDFTDLTPAILSTADGGLTWTRLNPDVPLGALLAVAYTSPGDPTTAVAAGADIADSGMILRTTDAGATWTAVLLDDSISDVAFPTAQHGIAVSFSGLIYTTENGGDDWILMDVSADRGLNAVSCVDSENCLAVGGRVGGGGGPTAGRLILRTTDGGASWTTALLVDEASTLADAAFLDSETAVTVGWPSHEQEHAGSTILKTVDGGDTWTTRNISVTHRRLRAVDFSDRNTGLAVGGWEAGDMRGIILKTTNGGNTWTTQDTGFDLGGFELSGVSLVNATTATIVGGNRQLTEGVIVRTEDGGDSWSRIDPVCWTHDGVEWSCGLNDISCVDADHCVAVGRACPPDGCAANARTTILQTSDGWSTYNISLSVPGHQLHGASCYDPDHCMAVGGHLFTDAIIWRTADGGKSWNLTESDLSRELWDVFLINTENAIAVGSSAEGEDTDAILRTTDGGESWSSQPHPASSSVFFRGVVFTDENTGVVVASTDTILRTTDGGASWLLDESGEAPRAGGLNGVSFTDASTGTAVGNHGSIIRTLGGPAFPLSLNPQSAVTCAPEGGSEDVQVVVGVDSVGGYGGTVALSTSGEPLGLTSDLEPDSVVPAGASVWTLTLEGNVPTDQHDITLTADDGSDQQLANFLLKVVDPAQAPALLEPANGATDVGLQPTFAWEAIPEVDTYRIQIAIDADFNDILIDEGVIDISFTPSAELASDAQHFWRVQGILGCAGAWSEVFSFTTEPQPAAEITPEGLEFELIPGETGDTSLDISNVGTGELIWSIETAQPPTATGDASVGGTSTGAQAATRDDRVDVGGSDTAALDLAAVLEMPLPSLGPTNPAGGVVDCDNEPNIVIHDDGTVENGYAGDPDAGVTEMSFVDRFTPSDYPASFRAVCVAFISMGPPSLDFEIVVFDDDGPSGGPGSELGAFPVSADGLPGDFGEPVWFSYDISSLGLSIDSGSVYIGVRWVPSSPNVFIASDESPGNPPGFADGYWWNDVDDVWVPTVTPLPNYRSLFVRAVEGPPSGCDDPTTVSWLSVTPDSGTTPEGGSTPVEVAVATMGLDSGEYIANLCIATNDFNPARSLIVVPVHLNILGAELVLDPSSLDFGEVEAGTTSPPQTVMLHNVGPLDATGLTFQILGDGFHADTSDCGTTLPADGSQCALSITFTPPAPGPAEATLEVNADHGALSAVSLGGTGATETEAFIPMGLDVDPEPIISDANGVFEPGELAMVAPVWQNGGVFAQVLEGTASDLTGPEGPTYSLLAPSADYGEVESGQMTSCQATELCYEMDIGPAGVPRPAPHWDATFDETLSDETTYTWSLHVGDSFLDVPRANPFYPAVETLLHSGVTGGCTDSEYCPTGANTRSQMPVFVLKALEGADYMPPVCEADTQVFSDVPHTSPFCPWIEELANRNLIAGCGGDNYCPGAPVTRAQMAIFLLKTFEGADYTPPECTGAFADVTCPSLFADWIEELATREITGGCSTEPPTYCPAALVTRQQMAVFVTKTFGLELYGP